MTRKPRSFTPEFKQEAAYLVLDQGYSIAEASRSVDVGRDESYALIDQLSVSANKSAPVLPNLTAPH